MDWTFTVIRENFPFFMRGLLVTCELTLLIMALGMIFGLGLALMRHSRTWYLRYPAMLAIEAVRGTPVIMLVFWFFFLVPAFFGPTPAIVSGVTALVIFNAGYIAEIVRGGIASVEVGQVEAARSTGMGAWHTNRHIVLPQALQNMTPALINQAVMLFKTTSILFIIGVIEFFRVAVMVNNREFASYEIFLFVGIVYLIPTTIFSRYSRVLERKWAKART